MATTSQYLRNYLPGEISATHIPAIVVSIDRFAVAIRLQLWSAARAFFLFIRCKRTGFVSAATANSGRARTLTSFQHTLFKLFAESARKVRVSKTFDMLHTSLTLKHIKWHTPRHCCYVVIRYFTHCTNCRRHNADTRSAVAQLLFRGPRAIHTIARPNQNSIRCFRQSSHPEFHSLLTYSDRLGCCTNDDHRGVTNSPI